jgi:hypothetical protein
MSPILLPVLPLISLGLVTGMYLERDLQDIQQGNAPCPTHRPG